jgi:DNA-directed RNA polymerase specialized sigma subunit
MTPRQKAALRSIYDGKQEAYNVALKNYKKANQELLQAHTIVARGIKNEKTRKIYRLLNIERWPIRKVAQEFGVTTSRIRQLEAKVVMYLWE